MGFSGDRLRECSGLAEELLTSGLGVGRLQVSFSENGQSLAFVWWWPSGVGGAGCRGGQPARREGSGKCRLKPAANT